MTEKTVGSQSSDKARELDLEELRALDSQHVTLAQAIEQSQVTLETTLKIKAEVIDEIERFRAAMRSELKGQRIKPDVLRDVFGFLGLAMMAGGISVAFHWSYALIVVGGVLLALSLVPLFRTSGVKGIGA